jgi:hypothetical protein
MKGMEINNKSYQYNITRVYLPITSYITQIVGEYDIICVTYIIPFTTSVDGDL